MSFRIPSVVSEIKKSVSHISNVMMGKRGDKKYIQATKKGEINELRKELYSANSEKKIDTIKKIIACITVGKDVSVLFADVVNCIQTSNIELKKLVYLYIINYASSQPELVILAVNTFRKDTLDTNPLVRALAIRTMGYIYLPQVIEYLIEPLKRACIDESDYVRKTASICVRKIYEISPKIWYEYDFMSILKDMISDNNPSIVYNSLVSFVDIVESFDYDFFALNNIQTSKLLDNLHTFPEWGQVSILDIINQYYKPDKSTAKSFIELIVSNLNNFNPSVVISTIQLILNLIEYLNDNHDDETFKEETLAKLTCPLLSLLSLPVEIQYVSLRNILLLVQKYPKLLNKNFKNFFCKYNDPIYIKVEKLKILIFLLDNTNYFQILLEFHNYVNEVDIYLVKAAINSIGWAAVILKDAAPKCVSILMKLIKKGVLYQLDDSINAMKDIYRKYPYQFEPVLFEILSKYNEIQSDDAKISALWILGEYAEKIPEVLKCFSSIIDSFESEPDGTKQQILESSIKVFCKYPLDFQPKLISLLSKALDYYNDVDLRERAIFYWRLLASNPEAVKEAVLAPKSSRPYDSFQLDPLLLEKLLKLLGTASSIFHILPESYMNLDTEKHQIDENNQNIIDLPTVGEKSVNEIKVPEYPNELVTPYSNSYESPCQFNLIQFNSPSSSPKPSNYSYKLTDIPDDVNNKESTYSDLMVFNTGDTSSSNDDTCLLYSAISEKFSTSYNEKKNVNDLLNTDSVHSFNNFSVLYPLAASDLQFISINGYLNYNQNFILCLYLRFEYLSNIPSSYSCPWIIELQPNNWGFFLNYTMNPKFTSTDDITHAKIKYQNLVIPLKQNDALLQNEISENSSKLNINIKMSTMVLHLAALNIQLHNFMKKDYMMDTQFFQGLWDSDIISYQDEINLKFNLLNDCYQISDLLVSHFFYKVKTEYLNTQVKIYMVGMTINKTSLLLEISASDINKSVIIRIKSHNQYIMKLIKIVMLKLLNEKNYDKSTNIMHNMIDI